MNKNEMTMVEKESAKNLISSAIWVFVILLGVTIVFFSDLEYAYFIVAIPMCLVFLTSFNKKLPRKTRVFLFLFGILTISPIITYYI
ncbi:hypothetical protein [Halarcobacter anaerophilus]|uniref:Uncharacterized protein n=1 Tax=Halarcobacter anaerophilus TaxID=877500 RepID=A0A4Q0XYX0_9BACT|nr:hypothetical protein [Halarcobacter anaerophilus]QDF29925.1 putative membrane protein [Halarcobacter anaerophilus]RXJ62887.1 hypothetical protein CRV06_08615 [Halarcobacter anaerophilus]